MLWYERVGVMKVSLATASSDVPTREMERRAAEVEA
jgi:hypothetical protein